MHAVDEEFLTVGEAATLMRVAPSTIRRWIREGDVPAYRLGQRRVGLRRGDLDRMVTPVGGSRDRVSALRGDEHPSIGTLTPEERKQGLEAMERLVRMRKADLARRGGKLYPSSWKILEDLREERTRQLMGME
jgi:excisionase family DNA binding protein